MAASRLQLSCNGTTRRAMRRLCLPTSLTLLLGCLCASFQLPPGPSPGFSLGYQTKIHLVMAQIRLQISCKWTKRRATWSIVALLPWQCCLSARQQVYSRPQAIGPALLMTISSLLGCGLCTGVLSEVFRYLLPGEGTAPASVSGAGTTSQLQIVVFDPISGHDLSRHVDPVSSVLCNPTATWVGNLLKVIVEFLSSPDPPAALWRRLLGHLRLLLFW